MTPLVMGYKLGPEAVGRTVKIGLIIRFGQLLPFPN